MKAIINIYIYMNVYKLKQIIFIYANLFIFVLNGLNYFYKILNKIKINLSYIKRKYY